MLTSIFDNAMQIVWTMSYWLNVKLGVALTLQRVFQHRMQEGSGGPIEQTQPKINVWFYSARMHWIESKVKYKTCIMYEKLLYTNAGITNILFIKGSWNKMHQFPQKYYAVQLFLTLVIIRNISWVANQQVISEGCYDTEDWSNYC